MNYTVIEATQRSELWFEARCGRLTASCAGAMLSMIKTGESAARRDLKIKLVLEHITKQVQEDSFFVNADMQRGLDLEDDGLAAYEAQAGAVVTRVGFLQADDLMVGCSPDGLLDGGRGGLELKCPRAANHLATLRAGGVPAVYQGQLLHSLWITGADFWDFASYCPQFPEGLQLYVHRVVREPVTLLAYEKTALKFLAEVEAEVESVRGMLLPTMVAGAR